jgi:hypothetical protein
MVTMTVEPPTSSRGVASHARDDAREDDGDEAHQHDLFRQVNVEQMPGAFHLAVTLGPFVDVLRQGSARAGASARADRRSGATATVPRTTNDWQCAKHQPK